VRVIYSFIMKIILKVQW